MIQILSSLKGNIRYMYQNILCAHAKSYVTMFIHVAGVTDKTEVDYSEETFKQFSTVTNAFLHLTSMMTNLLRRADFFIVRRACIEQIHTPNGAQLPEKVINGINSSHNIDVLLDILARSPYWSWIDIRLLEAMAVSSNIKQAKILIESYKNATFTKKLKDLLPNIPNKEVKEEFYSKIVSKLNKDPNEVTVWDLLKFQSQLEEVILGISNGVCILKHLEKGCIEVYWYIPGCMVDDAYKTALQNCDKFHSIDLQHLKIGDHSVIYQPSPSHAIAVPVPQANTGKLIIVCDCLSDFCYVVKDLIDHYYNYLSVNMDPEVVVRLMISQQLLSEDIVTTAQSCYNTNCLVLEYIRLMDTQTLKLFCELLKANGSQKHIGEMLFDGKQIFLLTKLCMLFICSLF